MGPEPEPGKHFLMTAPAKSNPSYSLVTPCSTPLGRKVDATCSILLVVKGMPSAGRLAAVIMSTLVKSSVAFRITPHIGREASMTQLHTLQRSFRCCAYTTSRPRPTPSMLLAGFEAGLGIVGISAVGAIRLLTANLVRNRVRVVTDIDDTVKSSGNKRLLGVPLGGIDAQCERSRVWLLRYSSCR